MAAISGGDGDLTSFLNEPQFSGDVSKNLVVASKSKPGTFSSLIQTFLK